MLFPLNHVHVKTYTLMGVDTVLIDCTSNIDLTRYEETSFFFLFFFFVMVELIDIQVIVIISLFCNIFTDTEKKYTYGCRHHYI